MSEYLCFPTIGIRAEVSVYCHVWDGVYTPPGRRSSSSGNGTDGSGTDGRNGGRELVVQQVKEAGVTLRYPCSQAATT